MCALPHCGRQRLANWGELAYVVGSEETQRALLQAAEQPYHVPVDMLLRMLGDLGDLRLTLLPGCSTCLTGMRTGPKLDQNVKLLLQGRGSPVLPWLMTVMTGARFVCSSLPLPPSPGLVLAVVMLVVAVVLRTSRWKEG